MTSFLHPPVLSTEERAALLNQRPLVVWFTGLSGSGKSTLAYRLEKELLQQGFKCLVVDGDQLRNGLNKDLGFTEQDRRENIRRAGELCKLLSDAGLIVITSFISPFRADRNRVRELIENDRFVEVYVNASLEVCEKRDPKGLYKKARAGEIPDFTGVSAPYEPPLSPDLEIDTNSTEIADAVKTLVQYVIRRVRA